jgi:hypothetical protein
MTTAVASVAMRAMTHTDGMTIMNIEPVVGWPRFIASSLG